MIFEYDWYKIKISKKKKKKKKIKNFRILTKNKYFN